MSTKDIQTMRQAPTQSDEGFVLAPDAFEGIGSHRAEDEFGHMGAYAA